MRQDDAEDDAELAVPWDRPDDGEGEDAEDEDEEGVDLRDLSYTEAVEQRKQQTSALVLSSLSWW